MCQDDCRREFRLNLIPRRSLRRYLPKQKEAALAKMMPPHNMTVPATAEETGIPVATLYLWRKKARESGMVVSAGGKAPDQWNSETKFREVVETMSLSNAKLGEYCRKKGIYPEQIAEWKQACMARTRTVTYGVRPRNAPKKSCTTRTRPHNSLLTHL